MKSPPSRQGARQESGITRRRDIFPIRWAPLLPKAFKRLILGVLGAANRRKTIEHHIATALDVGHKNPMEYRIRLMLSEEGWAVSCLSLPGCHSQGANREEAVENIKVAIHEWLEVEAEESGITKVEEDVVTL